MKIGLFHLDGKLPNLALMRIASHYQGESVTLRRIKKRDDIHPDLFDRFDRVYASAIFEKSRPLAAALLEVYPDAMIGGTGWDLTSTLEGHGITSGPDYSIYPGFTPSIGFTQRGCRLKCPFCVVSRKEGKVSEGDNIWDIYRGDPHPRNVILLDNDFFGGAQWERHVADLVTGGFRVNFNQGINARMITREAAEAIASLDYYDVKFTSRRIYTAWDNRKDEARLMAGLGRLASAGINADHIMVYMLIGYWPGETVADWEYRRSQLRAFGARPYPMPFVRTRETVGFQRWVVGAYDKRISWPDWVAADYEPRKLFTGAAPCEEGR